MDATAEPILKTTGLSKSFGHFAANAGIDFAVRAGELRAVIGPNGAGKTTFFNMLGRHDAGDRTGRSSSRARDVTHVARLATRAPGHRQSLSNREHLSRRNGLAELPAGGARHTSGPVRAAVLPPLDCASPTSTTSPQRRSSTLDLQRRRARARRRSLARRQEAARHRDRARDRTAALAARRAGRRHVARRSRARPSA